ncbi:MAG: hypothetical protein ACKO1J_02830, partial [Tagaea sp.]
AAEARAEGPPPEPDYKNLLEYVNNFGFPGTEPPQEARGAQHFVPEYWPNGQPPTPEDGALQKNPPHAPDLPNPRPVQPEGRRPPPFIEPPPDRVPQVADELPSMGPDGTRPPRPLAMPETRDLTDVDPEEFAEIYRTANEDYSRVNAEVSRLKARLEGYRNAERYFGGQAGQPVAESLPEGVAQSGAEAMLDDVTKAALGIEVRRSPAAMAGDIGKDAAKGEVVDRLRSGAFAGRAEYLIGITEPELVRLQRLGEAHIDWWRKVNEEKERRQRANP